MSVLPDKRPIIAAENPRAAVLQANKFGYNWLNTANRKQLVKTVLLLKLMRMLKEDARNAQSTVKGHSSNLVLLFTEIEGLNEETDF